MTVFLGGPQAYGTSNRRARDASILQFIGIGLLLVMMLTVLGIWFTAEVLHPYGRPATRRQHQQPA
jgi:Na+-driven multidrug efflux pump